MPHCAPEGGAVLSRAEQRQYRRSKLAVHHPSSNSGLWRSMNDLSHMTSVDLIVGLKLSLSTLPSSACCDLLIAMVERWADWLWIFVTMTGHRTHIVSSDDNKRVSLACYDLWNIYFQICIRWTWELVGACLLASKQSRPELLVESVWHSGWGKEFDDISFQCNLISRRFGIIWLIFLEQG